MDDTQEITDSESSWLENPKIKSILQRHLDETDYRIYKELNENGRISDTELGNRVGLSRTAARRRRENLEEDGIIDVLGVLVLQEAEMAYADVRMRLGSDASDSAITEFIDSLAVRRGWAVDGASASGLHRLFITIISSDRIKLSMNEHRLRR